MSRIDTISICVATHNEKSVLKLAKMMKSQKLESTDEKIWCAQLLGMMIILPIIYRMLDTTQQSICLMGL